MLNIAFSNIRIGLLLNLTIGVVFVVVAALVVFVVNNQMRRRALVEAESKARILLDRNLATHTYFSNVLKPNLFEWTDSFRPEEYFDPTWMSSTYVVREVDKYFKSLSRSDYYYKECAINARSPENEADTFERLFIDELNANPDLIDRSDIRNLDGELYFVTLRRGETMEVSCLICHSTPEQAPKELVDLYGPERSFNRQVGEVVSAISIRVPLSAAYAETDGVSLRLSGLLLILLTCLFGAQYQISKRILFNPLVTIRDKALQISASSDHLGEEIITPTPSSKEFNELISAFNVMSTGLRQNRDQLEERVRERTAKLSQANEKLNLEIAERERAKKEITRLYKQTQRDAESKGNLLHEVNHRVGNNLAAIISLLRVEQYRLNVDQDKYRSVFEDLTNRVQGLAMVHRLLSEVEWASLPLSVLTEQVIQSALQSLPVDKYVFVDLSPSSVMVSPKDANNLALVINELTTNSVKYAWPKRTHGNINVQIDLDKDTVKIEFRDDGVGYPEDLSPSEQTGVGWQLIRTLVGHSLDGELVLHNDQGAVTTISFPASRISG